MQSPTESPASPPADFKLKDILAEAKEENFSRLDAKELPTLLLKMVNYDGDAITRLAMRLMAHTFERASDLIESEWPEFELETARWDIPGRAHEDGEAAYRSLVTTIW
jgi:integrase